MKSSGKWAGGPAGTYRNGSEGRTRHLTLAGSVRQTARKATHFLGRRTRHI